MLVEGGFGVKSVGKFLVGGIIGAVVGILIAPKRGRMVGGALLRMTSATESILGRDSGPGRLSAPTSQKSMPAVATLTEAAPAVPAAPVLSSTPPQTPAAETVETPTQLLRESSEAAQQGAEAEVADLLEMPSGSVGSTESVPVVQPELAPAPVSEVVPEPTPELWSEPISSSAPEPSAELMAEPQPVPELEPVPVLSFERELEPVPAVPFAIEPEAPAASPVEIETDASPLVVEEFVPEVAAERIGEAVQTVETDLRARIEETRRRIQAELERPFQLETTPSAAEEARSAVGTEVIADVPVAESSRQTEGAAPIPPVLETFAQLGGGADPVAGPAEPQGFDYEEMRRRIEQTRSRLKAKAFDAMMSGETALLARDPSQAAMAGDTVGGSLALDAEVDETIENSLSEEDV